MSQGEILRLADFGLTEAQGRRMSATAPSPN